MYRAWHDHPDDPQIKALHEETGIPKQTLSRWYHRYLEDPAFRNYDYTAKGSHHRIFTDNEEQAIAGFIRQNYILQGFPFNDQVFKSVVMDAYQMKYANDENPPDFQISAKFIRRFKRVLKFSSRRGHLQRRPAESKRRIEMWKNEMADVFKKCEDQSRIVNCDKIAWRFGADGITTADTGADGVWIQWQGNTKDAITVLTTFDATGKKFPLYILAKGKTVQCE